MTFEWHDLAPRRPEERFRIYRLRYGELELLATTPTAEGMGVALCTLAEEGEWVENEAVGVLDTLGRDDEPGTWIVNPYVTTTRGASA